MAASCIYSQSEHTYFFFGIDGQGKGISIENQNYNILKESYGFFNHLMVQFEQTIELQSATYNLLNEIGKFTQASRVQLLKYEDGYYTLNDEWLLNGYSKCDIYPLKSSTFI